MNPSSQSQETTTAEPADPEASQKELSTETSSPSDTLLDVIRKTPPFSSEEFEKIIGALFSRFEHGRIDTYLQKSQILSHLKGSDAIQTINGYYGHQIHSKLVGDAKMASSTYFYTIKNQVTGVCTRLEAVFRVGNIEGLGGKNINDMQETSLVLKF